MIADEPTTALDVTIQAQILSLMQGLRERLGTSVIVGFPSETDEELGDTIRVCNAVGFDWVWCHGFSPGPGTPAASMPGQFSPQAVQARIGVFRAGLQRPEAVMLGFE